MTNKEAIELLQTPIHCADKGDEKDMREALSMAIKALENHDTFMKYSYEQGKKDALSQEPCDDAVSREAVLNGLRGCICDEWVKTLFATMVKQLPSVNPQPCDDAISRQAALDIFTATKLKKFDFILYAREEIKKLPSVNPQKSGKWINDKDDMPTCSKCGYIPPYSTVIDDYEYSNYCPNCGAKMESEE